MTKNPGEPAMPPKSHNRDKQVGVTSTKGKLSPSNQRRLQEDGRESFQSFRMYAAELYTKVER